MWRRILLVLFALSVVLAGAIAPNVASARGGRGGGGGFRGGGFGGFRGGGFGGFRGGGFRGGGFGGLGFARGFGRGVGFGFYPYAYPYGYPYAGAYGCWRTVRILTPVGPRLRRIWVCD